LASVSVSRVATQRRRPSKPRISSSGNLSGCAVCGVNIRATALDLVLPNPSLLRKQLDNIGHVDQIKRCVCKLVFPVDVPSFEDDDDDE